MHIKKIPYAAVWLQKSIADSNEKKERGYIQEKIKLLQGGKRVIVCCDSSIYAKALHKALSKYCTKGNSILIDGKKSDKKPCNQLIDEKNKTSSYQLITYIYPHWCWNGFSVKSVASHVFIYSMRGTLNPPSLLLLSMQFKQDTNSVVRFVFGARQQQSVPLEKMPFFEGIKRDYQRFVIENEGRLYSHHIRSICADGYLQAIYDCNPFIMFLGYLYSVNLSAIFVK